MDVAKIKRDVPSRMVAFFQSRRDLRASLPLVPESSESLCQVSSACTQADARIARVALQAAAAASLRGRGMQIAAARLASACNAYVVRKGRYVTHAERIERGVTIRSSDPNARARNISHVYTAVRACVYAGERSAVFALWRRVPSTCTYIRSTIIARAYCTCIRCIEMRVTNGIAAVDFSDH